MKLKEGILIVDQDNQSILVTTGEAGNSFSGMIKLNVTAAFIVKELKKNFDKELVLKSVLDEFEVTKDVASKTIDEIIEKLDSLNLVEK